MIVMVQAQTRIFYYPTSKDDKRNPRPKVTPLTDMTMQDGTKVMVMSSTNPHTFELRHPEGASAVVSVGEMLNGVIEATFNSINTQKEKA